MKAIITSVGEMGADLRQTIVYEIIKDNDEVLTEVTVTCMPSEAQMQIRQSLKNFVDEYEVSQQLTEGLEIS